MNPGLTDRLRQLGERRVVLDRVREFRQQFVFDQAPRPVRFRPAYGLLEGQTLRHDALLGRWRVELAKPAGKRRSRPLVERLPRLLRVAVELGECGQNQGIKVGHGGSLGRPAQHAPRDRRRAAATWT